MKKQLWLTSLTPDRNIPAILSSKLGPYGFDVAGSLWNDDVERMGWQDSRDMLVNPALSGWLIVTSPDELAKPSIRYGLSLLAITITAARASLPIFIITTGGAAPAANLLPTPFAAAITISMDEPSLCAKIVAKTSVPQPPRKSDYRIDIIGDQQVGQWFEIGSLQGEWKGALFGVSSGEINFQAVGPANMLPKDTVLNYPVQGVKLGLGDREFTAWGVQNPLPEAVSYFARVKGMPESILFGQFPEGDETELYTLKLI